MNATIRDVARRAGVSETTVSLAFKERSRISEKTRQRVRHIAAELDYVPNEAARALRRGSPRTLGLMVNDLTNPFYGRMVREVEAVAMAEGYQVLVSESQFDPTRELGNLDRMLQARIRGLLICFSETTPETVPRVRDMRIPCLALDTFPEGYEGPHVVNDLAAAGRLAVEHLLAVGCRRLALVIAGSVGARFSSFARLESGFREALRVAGLPCDSRQVISAGWGIEEGYAAFAELRRQAPETDGVLCGNDLCAFGLLSAADEAGIAVGPELAIMGIDDLPFSALPRLNLTSIRQPDRELAECAAQALIESIEAGERCSVKLSLAPRLIARSSTLAKTSVL